MNDLNHMVASFSKEDGQKFIAYLEKKNKRKDIKNIQLFKLLQNEDLDSKAVCLKLYSSNSNKTNAYHALRKRLFKSIINFSANSSLEDENSLQMEIIRYILAARNYFEQKQYKVAFRILNKAEKISVEHHLFSLLNEIYHTQIQYAHTNPLINLNQLIERFNKNKAQHLLEDQLNIIYSKIKYKLAREDNSDFQTILQNILEEYNLNITNKLSFKSLYQLISIVTFSAFASNENLKIEDFLIHNYNNILSYKAQEKQPYYHIQILYHIANTLFRNKKFKTSKNYLNKMHSLMLKYENKHYNMFLLKYNLLLALNYNFSNKQAEAIAILEPFLKTKHVDIESVLDIHLTLAMFYFQNDALKKAHQVLSKFYHSDAWYSKKAGKEWVIKKNLMEILLHIELGNINLVDSKLLSFKRQHYEYLKSINQDRAITYLTLVETYYKTPENATSETFKNKVEQSFEWLTPKQEDIFVMSFYAWLKSKMTRQPLYTTTLTLIQHASTEL
ncbi:hypothetical protein [Hyunsoonleella pacifica]|uniref:Tetratricopeptide repeat protein n=1 Tax=Hyunsoonleella pacifica TaxID=1080224 RepID=A0A4Q9FNS7_9FLAO|nr:hypothetical protein [Hyunsoonleella pacifica]TBN14302.1 hypothetical protein EYD46_12050 [Hyunsoonleella pacifica]GGD12629.1 hypothetical protein GCM10011368_13260 [Hyunsoonleella pacifica]